MRRLLAAALALLPTLCWAGSYGPQGTVTTQTTNSYTGPGNVVSGATAWWGLRGYSSAYAAPGTNPAVMILRASDNTTATINILSNGLFDTGTAMAFCNGTTCSVKTLYDQTGNGYNLTQNTAANQPQLLFSCQAFAPCIYFTGSSSQVLSTTAFTTLAQPYSISAVAERTGAFSSEGDLFAAISAGANGVTLGYYSSANLLFTYAGSAAQAWTSVPDSVIHALTYVVNGASSSLYADQTTQNAAVNIGNNSTYTTASMGAAVVQGTNYLTGYVSELGVWPIGISSTQASSIISNQQANWR